MYQALLLMKSMDEKNFYLKMESLISREAIADASDNSLVGQIKNCLWEMLFNAYENCDCMCTIRLELTQWVF